MPHADYLKFWGKQRGAVEGGPAWHAAAYHCLDVAASARALLQSNDLLRRRLAELLEIRDTQVTDLITFWTALHDIGKLSAPFHALVESLWLPEMGDHSTVPEGPPHGDAGFLLWQKALAAELAAQFPERDRLVPLARAIFGHHGMPVAEHLPTTVKQVYQPFGLAAARQFAQDAAALMLSEPIRVDQEHLVRASFAIAGVTVMADWVGSSALFANHNEPMPLSKYWSEYALPTARFAVREFGLVPCPSASERDLVRLMGEARFSDPTPMQKWPSRARLSNDPTLYIIEDSTGAGKTEAALISCHRLIVAGGASGVYFALPTMATANALYRRLAGAHRKRIGKDTMNRSEQLRTVVRKARGIMPLCKRIAVTGRSDVSEHELVSLLVTELKRAEPSLSDAQAFSKAFSAAGPTGEMLRKAIAVAKAAQVSGDDGDDDDAAAAMEELHRLAKRHHRDNPELTPDQSFARVFADPRNAALAHRAHKRPVANEKMLYPFPR